MGDLTCQAGAAVAGLVTLQLCGLVNLCLGALLGRWDQALTDLVLVYGLGPMPAQLALCAATALIAVILRWCLVIKERTAQPFDALHCWGSLAWW